MGFIDVVTPPVGIWIAFNQIAGPKEVVPLIESNHPSLTPDKQAAYDARAAEVLTALLHGGAFVPNGMTRSSR